MVDVPQADVVAILTRAPSAGGKTRLFASLNRPPDATFLTALLLDTLDGVAAGGVRRLLFVEPASACLQLRTIVGPAIEVMAQSAGPLGHRMRAVFEQLFASGAQRVAVVGSDLPAITPTAIESAFATLRRDPGSLVIGPATDGGYYLLAADAVPDVFDGIAWGTAAVLSQTRDAATRAGLRVHTIDPLADVDTRADLAALLADAAPERARRTIAWLRAQRLDDTDART